MKQPEDFPQDVVIAFDVVTDEEINPPYDSITFIEPHGFVMKTCLSDCEKLPELIDDLTLAAVASPRLARFLICPGPEAVEYGCPSKEYVHGFASLDPETGHPANIYGDTVAMNREISNAILNGARLITRTTLLDSRRSLNKPPAEPRVRLVIRGDARRPKA